eukprot:12843426-Alexandrium_andersonii.AAC.1
MGGVKGDLQKHLQLNAASLKTYSGAKGTIDQWCLSKRAWKQSGAGSSNDNGSTAMDVDALGKGNGTKGKSKTKSYGKSRDKDG